MKRFWIGGVAVLTVAALATAAGGAPAAPKAGVSRVSAKAAGGQVKLSGWATFSGGPIATANDSASDAAATLGGDHSTEPAAATSGAELLGADLIYRPELGDLFMRIRITAIPTVWPVVGDPSVLYGLRTVVSGVPIQIRAQSAGLTQLFGLFDCHTEGQCTQVTGVTISGGYGTTGEEIVASIPLSALNQIDKVKVAEGSKIATPHAFAARAPFAVGAVSDSQTMDDVVLAKTATVTIPVKSLRITIGKVTKAAPLKNGYFTVSFPTSAFGGKKTATATTRTCLGNSCVVQKFQVSR